MTNGNTHSRAKSEVGIILPPAVQLPAMIPSAARSRGKRRFLKRAWLLVLLLPVTIGAGYWWFHPGPALPPGFAYGNGRLEADEIDIDTKFAGRIASLSVD